MRISSYRKIALAPFLLLFALAAWAQPVVNVYSSMGEKDLRRLVAEFERRQGVKVNLWRSGKNRILERVLREARAGRHEVDVIHNPAPEMEALQMRSSCAQSIRRASPSWFRRRWRRIASGPGRACTSSCRPTTR